MKKVTAGIVLMVVTSVASGAMLDLQPQIDAVTAKGGGVVRVEKGEHEVKPFELKSNITLELADGATILASTNIADYVTRGECPVFIYADHATNVAIVGKGTINGRGGGFRETAKLRGEDQPKTLPLLMRFSRCRNVRLEGFHYTNPGSWACHLRNCDGVKVKGTSCFNYCNKMNDGLDIESCNVTVEDCDFYADDDSFCFKAESDKSFSVTNVVVRNCRMGSICNAIKFGTGSYNAFRDITIENCELRRSPGAWRWDWRKQMPGVTNRYYGRIASSITGVPPRDGMPARRPSNITLRNISLVAPGGGTPKEASDVVPEKDCAYPEAFMFNRMALPAYGFYVRHADDIRFENVKVETATPDARPEFYMEDCSRSEMTAALRKRLLPETDKFLAYNAVIASAHAYAARRDLFASIYCCHTPPSWADSVRKGTFIPFANVVNGALLDYDWTDLL